MESIEKALAEAVKRLTASQPTPRENSDGSSSSDPAAFRCPHCRDKGEIEIPGFWQDERGRVVARYEYCVCPAADTLKQRRTAEEERREREFRRQRVEHLFADAAIPKRFHAVAFETFPIIKENQKVVEAVKAYAWQPLPETHNSLILIGAVGRGKTGLAVCVLKAMIEREIPSLFFAVPDLLDRLRAAYDKDSPHPIDDLMGAVKTVDFLVLDDLGTEKVTEWAQEKLFQIVNARHGEMLPTLVTTNLSLDELSDRLGERTVWRLIEMGRVLHLKGKNLREEIERS